MTSQCYVHQIRVTSLCRKYQGLFDLAHGVCVVAVFVLPVELAQRFVEFVSALDAHLERGGCERAKHATSADTCWMSVRSVRQVPSGLMTSLADGFVLAQRRLRPLSQQLHDVKNAEYCIQVVFSQNLNLTSCFRRRRVLGSRCFADRHNLQTARTDPTCCIHVRKNPQKIRSGSRFVQMYFVTYPWKVFPTRKR